MAETSGTSLYDSTGNGNNATKVSESSPAAVTSSIFGVAQSFNGTSDYVVLPPKLTAGLTSFVLSFWVNTAEMGTGDANNDYYSYPQLPGDSNGTYGSGDFGIGTANGDALVWSGRCNNLGT
jgi:hypothetical protein